MKIKTFIFTYDRKEMLTELVTLLSSYDIEPIILDDGSTYDHEFKNYFRHEHRGKEGFWKTWKEALAMCKDSEAELFVFLQDDILYVDFNRIIELHKKHNHNKYAYHINNYGIYDAWMPVKPIFLDDEIRVGFVDCVFFCNKKALDSINYNFKERLDWTFNSSGVGYALSEAFLNSATLCYMPYKSIGYHAGYEDSKMHPEERIKNPLISK